uniref:Uncharacterized protein n=1 Tax=Ixodes ricinus TaxID=34613 RepID=A0A6B0TRT3_IXORI
MEGCTDCQIQIALLNFFFFCVFMHIVFSVFCHNYCILSALVLSLSLVFCIARMSQISHAISCVPDEYSW